MADTHATTEDPNAAPMHHDIKEQFTRLQIAIAVSLGGIAIAAGIVFGLLLAND